MSRATGSFKQFVFGFLGWFLFANIAFLVIVGLIINALEPINGVFFLLVFLWAPTAAMLIVLAVGKKISAGIGILVAVAVNTISLVWPLIFSPAILTPFPSTYIVYAAAVMDSISPPYNYHLHRVFDLYKVVNLAEIVNLFR